jgi:hypothetical protein
MSDAPQPVREPSPAEIVEEPISRPEPTPERYPEDDWDGDDDDHDHPARNWDGTSWPTLSMWWP